MKALLHHIETMTRQRDRLLIESCLVNALYDLFQADRVRLYKLYQPPGDTLVGICAERTAEGTSIHSDGLSWPEGTASIDHYRFLQACLTQHMPLCARDEEFQQWRHILLVEGTQGAPFGFVSIVRPTPMDDEQLAHAQSLVTIFHNCVALLDYSESDTLTGLLNRKTFDEYLFNILASLHPEGDENSQALRLPKRRRPHPEARDHWLGVMDIDYFKPINDNFGHLIGDEVLLMIANRMRQSFRGLDKLFRFGGEEFVVLLKPTEFTHAVSVFERFRLAVSSQPFPQVGTVTVSIGFTRIGVGDTASVVLDNADRALYWAKEHGRNQVCSYEKLLEEGLLKPQDKLNTEVELF